MLSPEFNPQQPHSSRIDRQVATGGCGSNATPLLDERPRWETLGRQAVTVASFMVWDRCCDGRSSGDVINHPLHHPQHKGLFLV
ncbi:MAG: hypothetical protein WDW36_003965 [Sanguina aurantia]